MTPHAIAAEALKRIQARPCECTECRIKHNLAAVIRITEAQRRHIALKVMEASA